MTTVIRETEPRILAAQHLRYGPRGYDEVMQSLSNEDAKTMRRAIDEGDVIHVAGMIRLEHRRRGATDETRAISPIADRIGESAHPSAGATSNVHPDTWRGDDFENEQTARMREVAKAIEDGARTREDICDVTGLQEGRTRTLLSKFIAIGYATEEHGTLTMTPWGRVMLTTTKPEQLILLSIARGARSEERLKRLETAERPGILDAIRSLQERGIIRKNRRYYEIKDPALTIAADVDGVPNEAEIELFIAAQ